MLRVERQGPIVRLVYEGGEREAKEVRLNAQRTCAFRPVRAYWMSCIYFVRDNRYAKDLIRVLLDHPGA